MNSRCPIVDSGLCSNKTLQVEYVLATSKMPNICFSTALPKYRAAAVCTPWMLWSILERTGLHTRPGTRLGLEAGFILNAYHFYTLLGSKKFKSTHLKCPAYFEHMFQNKPAPHSPHLSTQIHPAKGPSFINTRFNRRFSVLCCSSAYNIYCVMKPEWEHFIIRHFKGFSPLKRPNG